MRYQTIFGSKTKKKMENRGSFCEVCPFKLPPYRHLVLAIRENSPFWGIIGQRAITRDGLKNLLHNLQGFPLEKIISYRLCRGEILDIREARWFLEQALDVWEYCTLETRFTYFNSIKVEDDKAYIIILEVEFLIYQRIFGTKEKRRFESGKFFCDNGCPFKEGLKIGHKVLAIRKNSPFYLVVPNNAIIQRKSLIELSEKINDFPLEESVSRKLNGERFDIRKARWFVEKALDIWEYCEMGSSTGSFDRHALKEMSKDPRYILIWRKK